MRAVGHREGVLQAMQGAQEEAEREDSQHLAMAAGVHLGRAPRPPPWELSEDTHFLFLCSHGCSRGLAPRAPCLLHK